MFAETKRVNRRQHGGVCGLSSPRCVGVSLQGVEVEQRRRQTNGDVGRGHLVLVHAGHHVPQEEQQRPQRLPVLVRKQQDGRLSCNQLLILWKI